jgi:hypothetical protein
MPVSSHRNTLSREKDYEEEKGRTGIDAYHARNEGKSMVKQEEGVV